MNYRIEIGTADDFKTEYPADRAQALRRARTLSRKGDVAYVVGADETGDIGQIVYADGYQSGRDGERI